MAGKFLPVQKNLGRRKIVIYGKCYFWAAYHSAFGLCRPKIEEIVYCAGINDNLPLFRGINKNSISLSRCDNVMTQFAKKSSNCKVSVRFSFH